MRNVKGSGKLALAEFLNALFEDFRIIDTGREGSIAMEQIEANVRLAW